MFGLLRVLLGHGREAVGLAASGEAGERAPLEAPVRLGPNHLQEAIADERHRPERHARALRFGRDPAGDVDHADVVGSKVAEHETPCIAEVARKTAQVIDEHVPERASACVSE
ncbi:MAG TPA: hypothetical protein VHK47_21095 [Polyangia bacterium]|nr:hypothetical protein [Polyangia bacterium]